ncbi:hypothetical protein U1872_12865 [Sphingomonas sp. RB3P16]|uniref:hypothetical protein n=1 Tax=Parasphingomonas frigoris TaxID=3096163 RepID=UPI002FC8FB96
MHRSSLTAHLQSQIETQLALAALATVDRIRAMHEDLEKLYRTQLVAVVLAERFPGRDAPPFPLHLAATALAQPARLPLD